MKNVNVVKIAQDLMRLPSITPRDEGCLDYISACLIPHGFECERFDEMGTSNLYAKLSRGDKNYCFAGHTDVVPVINEDQWTYPPFNAVIAHDNLYGRGAVDMKGAIAAYLAALPMLLNKHPKDSFSMLLTSDEEGSGTYGTKKVVEHLLSRNEHIDLCLVGEPTSVDRVGDTLKIGRRGSLNGILTVCGVAGHVAYPHLAKNPIPTLLKILETLQTSLDEGGDGFDPSHLEITSIDVQNPTSNVIADKAIARFNIRFNPIHTSDSLKVLLASRIEKCLSKCHQNPRVLSMDSINLQWKVSGEAFIGIDQKEAAAYASKLISLTGHSVILSTSGGTSDARFIKDLCPVMELGLRNDQAHKINEHVRIQDLEILQCLYENLFEVI